MTRSDNDTWDLASSVGATATMVAAGRARASRSDNRLIADRFAEPLVRAVGVDFFTRWATGELDPAEVDVADAPWGMQRMTDSMTARTHYFDRFFAEATAAGIRQAVILASGLDARAYRLSWPSDMTLFEIDQPKVLEFKSATLAALGAQPTVELRMAPVDLRYDWPAALRQAGFDPAKPTAWSAEGLLAFLPPPAQDRLLDTITALSSDSSRFVADIFWNSPDGREALTAAARKWYEHGLDVSLDDLGYPGHRNDVADYLTGLGWRVVNRILISQVLADNALPVPSVNGERGPAPDNYYCTAILPETSARSRK
ncbi:class I SAM-dependent methyltransferase [Candidatus Mycobacterium methanotrophicum]|uniref:S-adenosyl-L-methionine-dependent methyltransferase n=1 Tax=Candidatus Mycobacterium methanotrophicum TaxID=2943498 RepID=A0ABY4QJZ2_9MYCO|nr:class I SAM-dependent methyltransferase [Candidatus Mycobacterium methanotrophicum]UQX11345.1 class I SAM-dependent methyltransferase [Candidatus Mycobacterium methanotrophicum]